MAARLLARRWPFYILLSLAIFGAQALFYAFARVSHADEFISLVALPIATVIATVYAGGDAAGTLAGARERWSRIVDRAWAVVIFDAALTLVASVALGGLNTGDAGAIVVNLFIIFFTAMMVYAEPYMCLTEEGSPFALIFAAMMHSLSLGWMNLSRIFLLFALQLLAMIGGTLVGQSFGGSGVVYASFGYQTLVTVLLAVVFAVAYLDTAATVPSTPE